MAQKRIDYYGQFTPTGVDTSQAKRLQALSGLAEQVGDIAFEVGAKIQTKRGAEAGIESGMEAAAEGQAPEAKEGFLSQISIYDQAYNEAALNAYSSGIRVDGRKKLMELEEQFADEPDPEKFGNQWEGYIKGVTKGLPPEMAANLRLGLEDDGMRVGGRITDARKKIDFDTNIATISQDVDNLSDDLAQAVYEGDETLAKTIRTKIESVLADNVKFIDPVKAQEIRDGLEDRLIIQSNLGQVDRFFEGEGTLREQTERAQEFLVNLIKTPNIDGLSVEQKSQLETAIQTRITNREKQLAENDTEQGIMVSDYDVGISEGDYTPEQVDAWTKEQYGLGNINLSKMTAMRKQARTVQVKQLETAKTNQQFASILQGNPNPLFTPTQTEINDFHREIYAPKFSDQGIESRLIADAVFIQRTNFVPDSTKSVINGMLTGGRPEDMIYAAMFVDRINEMPGKYETIVDKNSQAFASEMVSLMNAQIDPSRAYELALKYTDPRDAERISVRTEQIKKEFSKKLPDWVESATGIKPEDRGFADAQKQYSTIFNALYLEGASIDSAKKSAEQIMSANFKESSFGPMMFAPEDYYADQNGSVEYLRSDIAAEIRREAPGLSFDDENIFLLTDDRTQRTASRANPQYRVMIMDDNGEMIVRQGHYDASEAFLSKTADETLEAGIRVNQLRDEDIDNSYQSRQQRFEERQDRVAEVKEGGRIVTGSDIYGEGTVLSDVARLSAKVAREAVQIPSEARKLVTKGAVEGASAVGSALYELGAGPREALRKSKLIEEVEKDQAGE